MFVILSFLNYLTGVDGTNKAVEPYGVILRETECLCSVCRVGLMCILQHFQVHKKIIITNNTQTPTAYQIYQSEPFWL